MRVTALVQRQALICRYFAAVPKGLELVFVLYLGLEVANLAALAVGSIPIARSGLPPIFPTEPIFSTKKQKVNRLLTLKRTQKTNPPTPIYGRYILRPQEEAR